jgi:hypothetical membrane protein
MRIQGKIQTFRNRYPWVGPALWQLSVQYFVVQAIAAAAWSQRFSLLQNTISDLGNTVCGPYGGHYVCSPLHDIMNLSFITLGLTMLLGSTLLYHEFKKSRLSALGFAGMWLAGFGTILVGIFPENTALGLHFFGAMLPFFVGNLSIGLLGLALDVPRPLKPYSLLTSAVTVTALALFISHIYLGLDKGGMERLVSYPQTLWLITFGIYTSRNHFRRLRNSLMRHSSL